MINEVPLTVEEWEIAFQEIDDLLKERMETYNNHGGRNSIPFVMVQQARDDIRGVVYEKRLRAYLIHGRQPKKGE